MAISFPGTANLDDRIAGVEMVGRRGFLTLATATAMAGTLVSAAPASAVARAPVARLPRRQVGIAPQMQSWGVVTEVPSFERSTGVSVNTVLFFANLTDSWQSGINDIFASGRVAVMTLAPLTGQRSMDLNGIMHGIYDNHIRQWARFWGGRGVVRFAHEMNGSWLPWGTAIGAKAYVALWGRVRSVWRDEESKHGITHAPWLWSPNTSANGRLAFTEFYPGDSLCEYVGLDGYSYAKVGWPSFTRIFADDIKSLQRLSSHPISIAETGVDKHHPNRAGWVTEMFTFLEAHPAISGFNWFERIDTTGQYDWRISTPTSARLSFARGVKAWSRS